MAAESLLSVCSRRCVLTLMLLEWLDWGLACE